MTRQEQNAQNAQDDTLRELWDKACECHNPTLDEDWEPLDNFHIFAHNAGIRHNDVELWLDRNEDYCNQ